jgi:hypothetical protein
MKRLRSWRDVVEMLPQKHLRIVYVRAAMLAFVSLNPPALASEKHRATLLEGFQETPAVVTGATGSFNMDIGKGDGSFDFELSHEGIEGGRSRRPTFMSASRTSRRAS